MNIENNFHNAQRYLEMANEKLSSQEFEGALAALAKSYSHTRALLEQVQKLVVLKAHIELSEAEVPE